MTIQQQWAKVKPFVGTVVLVVIGLAMLPSVIFGWRNASDIFSGAPVTQNDSQDDAGDPADQPANQESGGAGSTNNGGAPTGDEVQRFEHMHTFNFGGPLQPVGNIDTFHQQRRMNIAVTEHVPTPISQVHYINGDQPFVPAYVQRDPNQARELMLPSTVSVEGGYKEVYLAVPYVRTPITIPVDLNAPDDSEDGTGDEDPEQENDGGDTPDPVEEDPEQPDNGDDGEYEDPPVTDPENGGTTPNPEDGTDDETDPIDPIDDPEDGDEPATTISFEQTQELLATQGKELLRFSQKPTDEAEPVPAHIPAQLALDFARSGVLLLESVVHENRFYWLEIQ